MKTFAAFAVVCASSLLAFAGKQEFAISGDTVLHADFEVPDSATCTVKPGTTIRFAGYFKFVVHGLLIARGTAAEPITFTCADRSRGSAAPACWCGLVFMGKSAGGYLRNCRFEGMYRCLAWGADPVFDSCEFAGNHCGLYCAKKASPHVKDCRFYRNVYAVMADYAMPVMLGNVITGNTVGVCLQIGSRPIAGPNTIFGNGTDIRSETALKGDSAAFSIQGLWELMNELY
jgi:hypothetical protein